MANQDPSFGGSPGNPDHIPATIVFGAPPGIPAALDVAAEHGDVNLLVELTGHAFCAVVLTLDAALDLNLAIAARVIDERRRRRWQP
jgi:hypothetical protein